VIEQQPALIGIESSRASMRISMPRPELVITQELPQMTMKSEVPKFTMDWQSVYDDVGLKRPAGLTLSFGQKATEAAHEGVVRDVREGDYLGNVTRPGRRVAQWAQSETRQQAETNVNIGPVPKQSPRTDWDKGVVNVSWSKHRLTIEISDDAFLPDVVIDPPYSIEVFLRNQPNIRISVEEDGTVSGAGSYVDQYVG